MDHEAAAQTPAASTRFCKTIDLNIGTRDEDQRGDYPGIVTDPQLQTGNDCAIYVPQDEKTRFLRDGFVVIPNVLSPELVGDLNGHLEDVLRGEYDRGAKPDKAPKLLKGAKPQAKSIRDEPPSSAQDDPKTESDSNKLNPKGKSKKRKSKGIGPIGFSGNLQNVKVLQLINMHKADSLFRYVETNKDLGDVVAQLAGWTECGVRLAQDQPPGAPPLVFHRDSPYFMFDKPGEVVTVWIALDDMDGELGPLEYVVGSHKWGEGRVGSSAQFFQTTGHDKLMNSAAEREGILPENLEIVSMAGLKAGGLSIHHGKTWHGSGKNQSTTRPRRGIGIHLVPADVRFVAEDAKKSRLWKSYVEDITPEDESKMPPLSDDDFPIVAHPSSV